jgi:hypothetical protein
MLHVLDNLMLTCDPVLRRQLPWLGLRERGPGGGGRRRGVQVIGEDPARVGDHRKPQR